MSTPCKAIFFDLSGVLYEGSTAIDGAAEVVNRSRDRQLTLRFVTNTATKSAATIIADLASMNIVIEPGELFTAPTVAIAYVKQQQLRPYCLVHTAIQRDFDSVDQNNPNCVILGDARDDLNYANLNTAFRLCQSGAPLIGIGMNKYFKDDDGLKLDAGPFIRALEWAANTKAIIMGKPSAEFFQQVVASTGLQEHECLMVGDDVIGDVKGAIDAGLQASLVKTGKYSDDDSKKLPGNASLIDSVKDLIIR